MALTQGMTKAKKRRKKRMMMMKERRWSIWLQIIPKRTLGMTQMPMRQNLLKLLVVEPVAVSFLFVVVVVVFFFFFFLFVNSW